MDDDRCIASLLHHVLLSEGYDVIVAQDGLEALDAVREREPDLVLLDVDMPRMTGDEVCRRLKSSPATRLIPVIMITANEGSRHKAYAEYLGVVDYIRKPFAMERLLEAVEKALGPAPNAKPKEPKPPEAQS